MWLVCPLGLRAHSSEEKKKVGARGEMLHLVLASRPEASKSVGCAREIQKRGGSQQRAHARSYIFIPFLCMKYSDG